MLPWWVARATARDYIYRHHFSTGTISALPDEIRQTKAPGTDSGKHAQSTLLKSMSNFSPRWIPAFRTEVLCRWQLDADDVSRLNGTREELAALLCDRFSLGK